MNNKKQSNRTFSFIAVIAVVIGLFTTGTINGANLHSVIVADTTDFSIGESTAVDLQNMRKEIQKIALYTGLSLKETTIEGEQTLPENVFDKVDALNIGPEDVVIFHFSGHGYRTSSKGDSPWPNLYFSLVDKGIDYEVVGKKLEQHQPRFLLVIADVCNSMLPDYEAPPLVSRLYFKQVGEDMLGKNYRSLFLKSKGMVFVTSSKAGEYSWGTDSGGLFTLAFLKHLNASVNSTTEPTWYSVLDDSAAEVQREQHPDFRIWLN